LEEYTNFPATKAFVRFFERGANGFVRHIIHIVALDHLGLQQAQRPPFSTFWRCATSHGDQMRFRFTIQTVFVLTIWLFPLNGCQSLGLKGATNICDGIVRDIQYLTDFGFCQAFIHFEQNSGSCHFASRCYT
jgi:hypothetical protein